MPRHVPTGLLLLLIATTAAARQPASRPARPSAEALRALAGHVERLVTSETIVGAELHVLQGDQTLLHEAFGWADRDDERRLETDAVFCIRSMTKPVAGTAVQMLLDEGRLTLDTRAAEHLPAFDKPPYDQITVRHLLTHTSGLPFSTISRPLTTYAGIADVAAEAATADLQFPPGSDFQYSDAGTDTLGALIAAVTGAPPEQFIQQRILDPLAMRDTRVLLDADSPHRKRVPSAYSGGPGAWSRHWGPDDNPIFPIFLASQSLYATTADYARFLRLWMHGGTLDGRQLLSPEAVRRAFAPGRPIGNAPGTFPDLRRTYGQLWVLHHRVGDNAPVVFGHDGSDGTFAWAWPDRDLIVLLFTQSRGTLIGADLPTILDRLLIRGDVAGFQAAQKQRTPGEQDLARLAGLYWDEDVEDACYIVRLDRKRLVVERPGRFRLPLAPTDQPGTFKAQGTQLEIRFEDAGDGPPAAMAMKTPNRTERQVRQRPWADAPDIVPQVVAAHGMQHLARHGAVRMRGTIEFSVSGMQGTVEQVFDRTRSRMEIDFDGMKTLIASDGDRVRMQAPGQPARDLRGIERDQVLVGHPTVVFGDWNAHHARVEVLKRIERDGRRLLLVRTAFEDGSGPIRVVDEQTGRLVAEQALEMIPGAGMLGVTSVFSDFREVDGLVLPMKRAAKYPNPLIGEITIEFDTLETNVDADTLLREAFQEENAP